MENLKNLGKTLNKQQQKEINGGKGGGVLCATCKAPPFLTTQNAGPGDRCGYQGGGGPCAGTINDQGLCCL